MRLRKERACAAISALERVAVGRSLAAARMARRLIRGVPGEWAYEAYRVDIWAIENFYTRTRDE